MSFLALTNNGSLVSSSTPLSSLVISCRIVPIQRASKKALWLKTHHTRASSSNSLKSKKKAFIASWAASSAPRKLAGTSELSEACTSMRLWKKLLVRNSVCRTTRLLARARSSSDSASQDRNTSGKLLYTALKSAMSFALYRAVLHIGKSSDRGEHIVSWTRLARVQDPRM